MAGDVVLLNSIETVSLCLQKLKDVPVSGGTQKKRLLKRTLWLLSTSRNFLAVVITSAIAFCYEYYWEKAPFELTSESRFKSALILFLPWMLFNCIGCLFSVCRRCPLRLATLPTATSTDRWKPHVHVAGADDAPRVPQQSRRYTRHRRPGQRGDRQGVQWVKPLPWATLVLYRLWRCCPGLIYILVSSFFLWGDGVREAFKREMRVHIYDYIGEVVNTTPLCGGGGGTFVWWDIILKGQKRQWIKIKKQL